MPSRDDDPRVSASYRMHRSVVEKLREFIRNNRGAPLFLEQGSFVEKAILDAMARTQREIDGQSDRRPSIALGRQRLVPSAINNRRTTSILHGDNP